MGEQKQITSTDIKLALRDTHDNRNTYFVTECKTCSTYFPDPQGLLIFDGLAITKSYTKPCIIGYEIKVSRSDFLGDNKWHLYLQYCNEFFFVRYYISPVMPVFTVTWYLSISRGLTVSAVLLTFVNFCIAFYLP